MRRLSDDRTILAALEFPIMPWLEQRSGRFLVSFRWQGKKYRQKIAAKTKREAEAFKSCCLK